MTTIPQGPVACRCGWDDQRELIMEMTPVGLLFYGDEGRPQGECPECGEWLAPDTVQVRLDNPGVDDWRVFRESHGKYDSAFAVRLERLWMDGDRGDEEASITDYGDHAVRYGRCIMLTTNQGFVSAMTCADPIEAEAEFARITEGWE